MQPYFFPAHGITIEAESLAEAQDTLQEQITSTSSETSDL